MSEVTTDNDCDLPVRYGLACACDFVSLWRSHKCVQVIQQPFKRSGSSLRYSSSTIFHVKILFTSELLIRVYQYSQLILVSRFLVVGWCVSIGSINQH